MQYHLLSYSALVIAWGLAPAALRAQTIPGGTTTTSYSVTAPGTYTLPSGSTLNYTGTSQAITATTAGDTVIDIEGQITDPNNAKGIVLNNVAGNLNTFNYTVDVGAAGSITTYDSSTISFKRLGNALNTAVLALSVNNQGQIIAAQDPNFGYASGGLAIDTKGNTTGLVTDPTAANFFTAGGTIVNGSTTNSAALIKSSSDVAIQMGSNQSLTNYGSIISDSPINDSGRNNTFKPGGGSAGSNDIGRAVEMGLNGDIVTNYGTITGAQHGVDESNSATNLVVNNYGTITGNNGSGIGSDTTVATATNEIVTNYATGKIIAKNAGAGNIVDQTAQASVDSDPDGIDIDGGATIYNYGLVQTTGVGTGYDTRGRANASDGVTIGGGNVFNYSSGQIISTQDAVSVGNDSVSGRTGATVLNLQNDGLIQGQSGYAIRSENKNSAAVDTDTVVNTGTIIGGSAAPDPTQEITIQNGAHDTLAVGVLDGVTYNNNGTHTVNGVTSAGNARFVQGDGSAIQMGQGNDVLTNTGAIYGTLDGTQNGPAGEAINMEDGDDTVNLEQGSKVIGDINGGNGSEVNGDTLNFDLDDKQGLRDLNGNVITPGSGGDTFTFASSIVNFEHVNAISGKTILSGHSTYAGVTTVGNGVDSARLEQNGTHVGGGNYHVLANGMLAGGGSVSLAAAANTITVDQGATFAPGSTAATGKFTVGEGSVLMNGTLSFRLDGTAAGVAGGYDQLSLTTENSGAFVLGGTATLSLTLGYTPTVGSSFTLVDLANASTAVTGIFAGLGEGADFISGGQEFQITYKGGDGNDIVITDIAAVPEPGTYLLLPGALGLLYALARRRSNRS